MVVLIQRVSSASVSVDGVCVGSIKQGLLALVGFEPNDESAVLSAALNKILKYRVFADEDDKMNLALQDIEGGLLLVPQFTLAAETRRGLRPSFSSAASPEQGQRLFEQLVKLAKNEHPHVETGIFGADMQVALVNNGPVTFNLKF